MSLLLFRAAHQCSRVSVLLYIEFSLATTFIIFIIRLIGEKEYQMKGKRETCDTGDTFCSSQSGIVLIFSAIIFVLIVNRRYLLLCHRFLLTPPNEIILGLDLEYVILDRQTYIYTKMSLIVLLA